MSAPTRRSASRWTGARLRGALAIALAAAGLSAPIVVACLPADTRPEPGYVITTVSASDVVTKGVTTQDGWTLTFSRVLVGMRALSLPDPCVSYAIGNYDRIFNLSHLSRAGGDRVGIVYGLGKCDVRFRVGSPGGDALLGPGVVEDDKTFLRTGGTDRYVTDRGIALHVEGSAGRPGSAKKTFALSFRARVNYSDCGTDPVVPDGGQTTPAIELSTGTELTYDLRVEPEAIFRDDVDVHVAGLRFDPFAGADENGDGKIEIDELDVTKLEDVRNATKRPYGLPQRLPFDAGPALVTSATLEDYVYLVLFPTVARFRGAGACTPSLDLRRRGGRGGGPL